MAETSLAQYLDLAQNQQHQGKLTEAIAICRQAIEVFPGNYQLYDCLREILVEQGDLDNAIAIFGEIIELHPDVPWLYYNLAQVQDKQNNFTAAISSYQQAIELKPDFNWFYFHLGKAFSEQGNFTAAITCYQKALELKLENPWLHYFLAEALTQQENLETAIAHYQQGIKINPNLSVFYEKIYFLRSKIDRADSSINSTVKKSLDSNKLNRQVASEINSLRDRAKVYIEQQELELALECYQKIISIDDNYGGVYYQIGRIYEQLKQLNIAQQYYQKANFLEDFTADSQVMLVFFSARHITARCRYHFLDLVKDFPVKKLFIRDIQDVWYNKGLRGITKNVEQTAAYLKNIIEGQNVRRVIFLRASSGGYAALLYGYLLKVDEIHAFGAQTKIPNSSEEIELLKDIESEYLDLTKIYQVNSTTTNCHLYFDSQFPPDVEHAYRLQNMAMVKLHGYCAGVGHKITMWLKHQELLEPIILNAL